MTSPDCAWPDTIYFVCFVSTCRLPHVLHTSTCSHMEKLFGELLKPSDACSVLTNSMLPSFLHQIVKLFLSKVSPPIANNRHHTCRLTSSACRTFNNHCSGDMRYAVEPATRGARAAWRTKRTARATINWNKDSA